MEWIEGSRLIGLRVFHNSMIVPITDSLYFFMNKRQFETIKGFPIITVLPLVSRTMDADQACFGAGFSQLLMRNLMLLPNVSVLDPNDTPRVHFEDSEMVVGDHDRRIVISGKVRTNGKQCRAKFYIHSTLFESESITAGGDTPEEFYIDTMKVLTEKLGGTYNDRIEQQIQIGQPRRIESLFHLGKMLLEIQPKDMKKAAPNFLNLYQYDPSFTVPLWNFVAPTTDKTRQMFLAAIKRDPANAFMYWIMFNQLWKIDSKEDPVAFQFCRKAVEISPGLARAHLCMSHAAPVDRRMLAHAILSYTLIPRSTEAICNYISVLKNTNGPLDLQYTLGEEGMRIDSKNPILIDHMIDISCKQNHYKVAMDFAQKALALFSPAPNPHAMTCLSQNPERRKALAAGKFKPVDYYQATIRNLKKKIKR
jgi:hypothetical protein